MVAKGLVYPVAPECLVAVDASGVDPQQDGDAVSGAAGYLWGGYARVSC